MTAVMAEKDPPVFRDFLGIGRKDDTAVKQPAGVARRNTAGSDDDGEAEIPRKASSGTSGQFETSVPASGLIPPPFSTAFPTSSDPGSGVAEGWLRAKSGPGALQHHGVRSAFYKPETENKSNKRRDSPVGRESLQERLQMSVEALENSRPQKVARVENKDEKIKARRIAVPGVDELRLSMQPPRVGGKNLPLLPVAAAKPELSCRMSKKKPERPRPSIGASVPARLSHLGMSSERVSVPFDRESDIPAALAPQAPDEGSRTGIKGSPLGGLLSAVQATQSTAGISSGPATQIPPRRLKVSSNSAGSDSMIPARHQFSAPPSRQLTIFYGGQAHVFDEVPPDKANQIMQLAGSNGRSWSTTYSPRQTTGIANSATEESHAALERLRDKNVNVSHGGSIQNGGTLTLSTEVQTLLRGLALSSGSHGHPLPDSNASPLASEIQLQQALADRVSASSFKRDNNNGRNATRPVSCTDDMNAKEALLQGGQRWM